MAVVVKGRMKVPGFEDRKLSLLELDLLDYLHYCTVALQISSRGNGKRRIQT